MLRGVASLQKLRVHRRYLNFAEQLVSPQLLRKTHSRKRVDCFASGSSRDSDNAGRTVMSKGCTVITVVVVRINAKKVLLPFSKSRQCSFRSSK